MACKTGAYVSRTEQTSRLPCRCQLWTLFLPPNAPTLLPKLLSRWICITKEVNELYWGKILLRLPRLPEVDIKLASPNILQIIRADPCHGWTIIIGRQSSSLLKLSARESRHNTSRRFQLWSTHVLMPPALWGHCFSINRVLSLLTMSTKKSRLSMLNN